MSGAQLAAVALARTRTTRLEGAVRRVLPGLLLAAAVGLTAHLAARAAFPYALTVGFEVPLAMLLGLILVNVGGAGASTADGVRFAVKYVLGIGIVLLGLRLNLQSIAVIGAEAFVLLLVLIGAACTFAVLVGRRLGVPGRVAVLIGVGSSVCGNSAIMAAAPVVRADDRQVSFAVATITITGTLAVFLLPLVGHALQLDMLAYGLWAGAAVPDTAQTIASSAAYSTVARDVATVVKLVRNVLMAPLVLLIAWGWSRYGDDSVVSADAARRGVRRAFPFFLIGFLAMALVRTARLVDPETIADVDVATRACFVVAVAGLGLQTRLGHLRGLGWRPFALGLGTSGLLAGASLALILALGLGPTRTAVAGGVDPRQAGAWAPVCKQGAAPAFSGTFVALAQQLRERMGTPLGCAEADAATGDTVQRTSRGVATLRRRTGLATFSDGRRTWSIRGAFLLEWSGPAHVPPGGARAVPIARTPAAGAAPPVRAVRLGARVVAAGIPGAGALSPVGSFHPGGPIHDKRRFAAATRRGRVLDPSRLLVASSSNFGAPPARGDWAPGSVLSIATDAPAPLVPPAGFASSGGQARALNGAVQLYTAQSPSFVNRLRTPSAKTAAMPGVGNPTGISVNNAFGRPWFSSAPTRDGPGGVESVLDPDGRPLADAPSERAGGVFAGALTNRHRQHRRGALNAGVVGNALLGASPDTSNRAVFAVATADGALAQVHVEEGVDGLAPAGTLAPLIDRGALGATPPDAPTRVGMVFNWVPERFLYVSDPRNDAVLQLRLEDDFKVFEVAETRRLQGPYLSQPVDLAPAVPEIASPAFASNTTLAGGSDLYVANRGSGTIVRMRQDGQIRAVARVGLAGGVVGGGLLNGIAVSPDGNRIWLSLSSRDAQHRGLSGSVIEIPAFGAPG